MTAFVKFSALAAVSLMLAGPAAAYGVSPSAPDSEQNATTVQVRDMQARNGQSAPRSGASPIATRSEQNATTLQLRDMPALNGHNAPRSGVNPSAPASQQD